MSAVYNLPVGGSLLEKPELTKKRPQSIVHPQGSQTSKPCSTAMTPARDSSSSFLLTSNPTPRSVPALGSSDTCCSLESILVIPCPHFPPCLTPHHHHHTPVLQGKGGVPSSTCSVEAQPPAPGFLPSPSTNFLELGLGVEDVQEHKVVVLSLKTPLCSDEEKTTPLVTALVNSTTPVNQVRKNKSSTNGVVVGAGTEGKVSCSLHSAPGEASSRVRRTTGRGSSHGQSS